MDDDSFTFLETLLTSPGPSGYEAPLQQVVRRFASGFAAAVETDWHGNVVATVHRGRSPRVMLAGHCDQIGLMVTHVDVTHATDCPDIDQNQFGRVKIGEGPVVFRRPNINPVVYERLSRLAAEHDIPIQPAGIARAASNDGNALQINRGGVATGIVSIPNRYMHSPGSTSWLRLGHTARLPLQHLRTYDRRPPVVRAPRRWYNAGRRRSSRRECDGAVDAGIDELTPTKGIAAGCRS